MNILCGREQGTGHCDCEQGGGGSGRGGRGAGFTKPMGTGPVWPVTQTGGNRSGLTGYRSNQSGPVSVRAGTKPVQIQNLNLNSKNEKFPKNS